MKNIFVSYTGISFQNLVTCNDAEIRQKQEQKHLACRKFKVFEFNFNIEIANGTLYLTIHYFQELNLRAFCAQII